MKLYCGIDLHANNSVISIQDEEGKVHYEKRLPNDLEVRPVKVLNLATSPITH